MSKLIQTVLFFSLLVFVPLVFATPGDGSIDSTVEINGATANGPTHTNGDAYGKSVANIGDLNNDGVTDIVVGANGDDAGGSARGAVHIHFMNTDGSIDSTAEINQTTTNGPTGLINADGFGYSVAGIGDLNDDGAEDIAVGTPLRDQGGGSAGSMFIVFLNTNGSVSSTVEINGSTTNGPSVAAGDQYGYSISSLGDLNGDGVEDIVVGAPFDDAGGNNRGAVHIHYMNTDGSIDSTVEINDTTTNGPVLAADADRFGSAVANIGDLNDDGVIDLLIGANGDDTGAAGIGAAYISFINTDGSVDSTVKIASNTTNGPTLSSGDLYGESVAALGDFNEDGVEDIAVGASSNDGGGTDRGAVHIHLMNTDGSIDSTIEINDTTTNGPSLADGDSYGASIASLGDLNGNGVIDIIGGATSDDGAGTDRGAVHISFMAASSDSVAPSISLTALSPDPTTDSTPTITGTATEAVGTVASVEFQIDSTAGDWTACTADDGTFDEASEAFSCLSDGLLDGAHTMYVRATDSNANTTAGGSESSDTFTVDTTYPAISLTALSPDPTTDTTPTITGTATDTHGTVTDVEFQIDSTAGAWTNCTANDGTFDEASEAFSCTSGALADGSHTMYVRATDSLGNITLEDEESSDTFIVDTTDPSVSLTALTPDPTTDTTPTLTGTASDTDGEIASTEFQIDSEAGAWSECTADDGTFDEASEAFSCTSGELSVDTHTMYVRTTDAAGNVSATQSDEFAVASGGGSSGDTTSPLPLSLRSPGNYTYTNNKRPTFKWKATTDADSGMSTYKVEIDNGETGDFSIDDIPASRTKPYETARYRAIYENFGDSDAENDVIAVYTKSSSDWGTDNNDGELKEGKRTWTVKARDASGNEAVTSRTLFVDNTTPTLELTQINDAIFVEHPSTYSTTDTTPTFFGKMTDMLAGDSGENVVAAGPELVEIKIEQKIGLEYQLYSVISFNMGIPWYTCDHMEVPDVNKEQKCDKYLPFEYTQDENLPPGIYRITFSGEDKAENHASTVSFILYVTSYEGLTNFVDVGQFDSDEFEESEEITVRVEPRIIEKVEVALIQATQEVTAPVKNWITLFFEKLDLELEYRIAWVKGEVRTLAGKFNNSTITYIFDAASEKLKSASQIAGYAVVRFGYLFITEPTKITNVKVIVLSPTSATISWETNHPANGKVNYGFDESYAHDVQSEDRVTLHEFTLTDLEPGSTYYFEVMSHNNTYVYDANRKFRTPIED